MSATACAWHAEGAPSADPPCTGRRARHVPGRRAPLRASVPPPPALALPRTARHGKPSAPCSFLGAGLGSAHVTPPLGSGVGGSGPSLLSLPAAFLTGTYIPHTFVRATPKSFTFQRYCKVFKPFSRPRLFTAQTGDYRRFPWVLHPHYTWGLSTRKPWHRQRRRLPRFLISASFIPFSCLINVT